MLGGDGRVFGKDESRRAVGKQPRLDRGQSKYIFLNQFELQFRMAETSCLYLSSFLRSSSASFAHMRSASRRLSRPMEGKPILNPVKFYIINLNSVPASSTGDTAFYLFFNRVSKF